MRDLLGTIEDAMYSVYGACEYTEYIDDLLEQTDYEAVLDDEGVNLTIQHADEVQEREPTFTPDVLRKIAFALLQTADKMSNQNVN